MIDPIHDLQLLIRSRHPLIVIESVENDRIRGLLHYASEGTGSVFFEWSRLRGLARAGVEGAVYGTEEPLPALSHVRASTVAAVYHFPTFTPFLGDAVVRAAFEEAVAAAGRAGSTIVLTGAELELDSGLRHRATRFTLPAPSPAELTDLIRHLVRDLSQRQHVDVALSQAEMSRLLGHLAGLTLMEAEKILTKAIVEDGRLTVDDIRHVIDAKKDVIEREGLLEYYPLEESVTEVADLVRLKEWLGQRKAVVRDPEAAARFGLGFPRGVLLLGVPGCGKSLSAKAVAAEWELPLLRLDPSNLYNKYIGESERNFKRAMVAAERMAPVILWIDELEKAFASGGGEDGGVSTRILGSFLSWMQERRGDVFVVATANQISRLPPELLRKGRFDEIFFVDLPSESVRRQIYAIHLKNRRQDPSGFDLDALARASAGFSGAEIEQVVVSSLLTAFASETLPSTESLIREVELTVPLSRTMAERIESMRSWAKGRAVSAN